MATGFTPDYDSVGGSMTAVVRNTSQLPPEDRAAVAEFVKALPPVAGPARPAKTPKGGVGARTSASIGAKLTENIVLIRCYCFTFVAGAPPPPRGEGGAAGHRDDHGASFGTTPTLSLPAVGEGTHRQDVDLMGKHRKLAPLDVPVRRFDRARFCFLICRCTA